MPSAGRRRTNPLDLLPTFAGVTTFVNANRRETMEIVVPPGLDMTLPVVGWRDRKVPLRGCLLLPGEAGLVLRATEAPMARRIGGMCDLCRTPRPGDEVQLFVARRRRRDTDSIGYYGCADLDCGQQVAAREADALVRRVRSWMAAVHRS
jgi:hypothetical protein